MNSRLAALTIVAGIFVIGGTSYTVFMRTPPGLPMADLVDAGLISTRVDRWVMVCPEKITRLTATSLRRNGFGDFRDGTIHRIGRVVYEYNEDKPRSPLAAACSSDEATVFDGGWCRRKQLINPSLDAIRDAGFEVEEGGDDSDTGDDAFQFRTDDCYRRECDDADGGISELRFLPDGGFRFLRPDQTEQPFCNAPGRRGRVTPPCVIPNCWTLPDGGWDDDAVVDCRGTGLFGVFPGGEPRWRGCNTTPAQFSVGTQCVPVECTVVAGDDAPSVLR